MMESTLLSGNATVASAVSVPPSMPAEDKPVVAPPWSLYQRLSYSFHLWSFKIGVVLGLGVLRLTEASKFKVIGPTYIKYYQEQPSLQCRVFLPKISKSGAKLPLYIDIHGGGFALCDAQTDDSFCRSFADKFGFCVVAISYRKAPLYPWPYPVNDCAVLAKAVLADPDLPVDRDRVALGGFSAGGNLSLAIAQLPGIKENIKALVPVYPVVDFTGRWRGEHRTTPDGKEDMLKKSAAWFNYGYISNGVDRRAKTLSTIYATREDLPEKVYFIGAEYDYLCHEASMMAKRLAGIAEEADAGDRWEKNWVRWEMVPGVQHGFTHVPLKGEEERKRKELCDAMYGRIADWIKKAFEA